MRGGARIGAGRPRKVRIEAASAASPPGPFATAADFLVAILNAEDTSLDAKLKAARTLLPYQHAKPAPVPALGKKAQADADAQMAGLGTEWEEILRPRPPLALITRKKEPGDVS